MHKALIRHRHPQWRGVMPQGNPVALAAIDEVFETCTATWRGKPMASRIAAFGPLEKYILRIVIDPPCSVLTTSSRSSLLTQDSPRSVFGQRIARPSTKATLSSLSARGLTATRVGRDSTGGRLGRTPSGRAGSAAPCSTYGAVSNGPSSSGTPLSSLVPWGSSANPSLPTSTTC